MGLNSTCAPSPGGSLPANVVPGTVGNPVAGIAQIMGVDRILGMSRTAINVSGDLVAAKLMDVWVGASASLHEEQAEEARHEAIRVQTGEDVIISKEAE